jgi:divalent metal cation (Fe/Co/Zn/Cd) transporter
MSNSVYSQDMSLRTAGTARADLVRAAFVLEWLTLAWVILEAALGIWASVSAHSVSLMAFGADSVIEAISACLLLWRLNVELREGQAFSEDAERKASKIGGILLFALAVYVVVSAAWGLWTREGQEFSRIGLAITAATIPVMYVLAKCKIAVADQIGRHDRDRRNIGRISLCFTKRGAN